MTFSVSRIYPNKNSAFCYWRHTSQTLHAYSFVLFVFCIMRPLRNSKYFISLFFLNRGVGTKSPLYNNISPSRRSSSDCVSNRTEMREGYGDGTTYKILPYFLSCHKK